ATGASNGHENLALLRSRSEVPDLLTVAADTPCQAKSGGPSLAVVGCGYWGAKHIRVTCDCRSARVAMVADRRPERLEYVRSQYPAVAVSRDFEAILSNDGIDGVIIAT